MKLRIRGNTLRLRLQRGEVQQFVTCGRLYEHIEFAGARLRYGLEHDPVHAAPVARFADATISVHVPSVVAERWASTDQVSLRAEQPLADGGVLALLVEKDFACLEPRPGEDDSDAYAHPLADAPGCKP